MTSGALVGQGGTLVTCRAYSLGEEPETAGMKVLLHGMGTSLARPSGRYENKMKRKTDTFVKKKTKPLILNARSKKKKLNAA